MRNENEVIIDRKSSPVLVCVCDCHCVCVCDCHCVCVCDRQTEHLYDTPVLLHGKSSVTLPLTTSVLCFMEESKAGLERDEADNMST